ncbi:piggyBac transposable element-derived protein 3-like [Rhagoletis pomonella]|uniref:piggyBac transposable element-derived protein 3-like n=1 Tax=Rhagoletis pomonella TaxID=28610 RepID=UPI00177C9E62|nr:piggyBac transposable element-derived protein 3-like [Rhagoletis pomonella]
MVLEDAEKEIDVDLEASMHDSFIRMITEDNNEINLNEVNDSDDQVWELFPSQFKNVSVNPKSSEFERVLWKKGNLQFNEQQVKFRGDSSLSDEVKALDTSYKVWCYLFPQSLEEYIVLEQETLKYAGLDESFSFDVFDLRKFIGILFYMSYYHLPNSRDYWSSNDDRSASVIKRQMPMKRFEKIPARNDPLHDRLYLIRPVIDTLNKTFGSIPTEQRLCIDEQMCSTKIGSFMKQYLPNKPKKWGFKFFVLCDTTGYAYKYDLYTGLSEKPLEGEPDLQPSANIVVGLMREVRRFQNHIVYFDNYYTTLPLLVYLRTQGILSVGTIRRNRIKNCKLPEEKIMLKFERGTSKEFVSNICGIDVTPISWKDNRVVNMVSTYIGRKPLINSFRSTLDPCTVKRYDKKEKATKTIPCPQIVKDYNQHMGGVDLMDSFMSRHKITLKSRKWTNRVFYHLLDMTCIRFRPFSIPSVPRPKEVHM